MAAFRGLYRCFCESVAGKLCQVTVPILLRKDRATQYKYNIIVVLQCRVPWLRNAFMTTCKRGGKKRDSNISDFTSWLETYRKERLKCHSGIFFSAEEPGRGTFAVGTIADVIWKNWHEVPMELFPNHPCEKKASVFCFHQTTVLVS